jgi:futalosine hydrolase
MVLESMNHHVEILITGVGAVPTAFALTRFANDYDLIINIGIAGSYNSKYSIGDVVCVKEDAFGDYGIDDRGIFKPLSGLNFSGNTLYSTIQYINDPWIESSYNYLNLPLVKGLTLSTASGSKEKIDKIIEYWGADIETMEGASVFYVCKQLNKPFICIRSISNMVEPRDKSKWETGKAIENLDKSLRQFIQSLS